VTVDLVTADSTVTDSLRTAMDGTFVFINVGEGDYTIRESDPEGFVSTTENTVSVSIPFNGAAAADFGDRLTPAEGLRAIKSATDLNAGALEPGDIVEYRVERRGCVYELFSHETVLK